LSLNRKICTVIQSEREDHQLNEKKISLTRSLFSNLTSLMRNQFIAATAVDRIEHEHAGVVVIVVVVIGAFDARAISCLVIHILMLLPILSQKIDFMTLFYRACLSVYMRARERAEN
jgi:hypothetical protein